MYVTKVHSVAARVTAMGHIDAAENPGRSTVQLARCLCVPAALQTSNIMHLEARPFDPATFDREEETYEDGRGRARSKCGCATRAPSGGASCPTAKVRPGGSSDIFDIAAALQPCSLLKRQVVKDVIDITQRLTASLHGAADCLDFVGHKALSRGVFARIHQPGFVASQSVCLTMPCP